MASFVALLVSLISLSMTLWLVARAQRVLRLASNFSSAMKLSTAATDSVASFESRMQTLEDRYESVAKRAALNSRRDPVTGLSVRQTPKVETKDDLKRRLGMVGANAARAAHQIHLSGGVPGK